MNPDDNLNPDLAMQGQEWDLEGLHPNARPTDAKLKPKRKAAAQRHALLDEHIELSDNQIHAMRTGYEERMKEEKRMLDAKREKLDAAQLIQSMMHGQSSRLRLLFRFVDDGAKR